MRKLARTIGVMTLSLAICILVSRADARPFEEQRVGTPQAQRDTRAVQQTNGGGPFAGGVRIMPGSRVINWSEDFSGASLESFKQCVVDINNGERERASTYINTVRAAKWSVDRVLCDRDPAKAGATKKSVERRLRKYQEQLGQLETELAGVLKGNYPRRLLMMNSPGGYVYTLKGMLPYLRDKTLDVYGGQMIASAGGVAFVAAKGKRIMPESGGQIGIHSVQSGVQGGIVEVEHAAREMRKMNKFLEDAYVNNSKGKKLTRQEFQKWIKEGAFPEGMKWLSGRQAMAFGICDALSRDPNKLFDSYRPTEIAPVIGEVKMFFEQNGLKELWKETPHGLHGHHHRHPDITPAAAPGTPATPATPDTPH